MRAMFRQRALPPAVQNMVLTENCDSSSRPVGPTFCTGIPYVNRNEAWRVSCNENPGPIVVIATQDPLLSRWFQPAP